MLLRVYKQILDEHVRQNRQMAFLSGARQVGKTTVCRSLSGEPAYFNWDDTDDRQVILAGPGEIARALRLEQVGRERRGVVFDEIHRYRRWKGFLKGFFDKYGQRVHVIVTGSSRLDVYRRGGDSLMGRYFLYRMHPLSIAELIHQGVPAAPIREPRPLADPEFQALWAHGGYPDPFLRRDRRFSNRWRDLRLRQLVREDIRDLTRIQELGQLEVLVTLLAGRSGMQLVYSNLAAAVRVSVDTARRWVDALCSQHFGFLVRPWFKNVAKSLRKEPKWFTSDWSAVDDPGQRAETFVACHLLKAVEGWSDLGLGRFELRYLRDKEQREVDFVVVRDGKPWFLVEVKTRDTSLAASLGHFQRQIAAPHAFQVVLDADYVEADPFQRKDPCVVPARTLLSQLL